LWDFGEGGAGEAAAFLDSQDVYAELLVRGGHRSAHDATDFEASARLWLGGERKLGRQRAAARELRRAWQ
jgi:hypothetical protein